MDQLRTILNPVFSIEAETKETLVLRSQHRVARVRGTIELAKRFSKPRSLLELNKAEYAFAQACAQKSLLISSNKINRTTLYWLSKGYSIEYIKQQLAIPFDLSIDISSRLVDYKPNLNFKPSTLPSTRVEILVSNEYTVIEKEVGPCLIVQWTDNRVLVGPYVLNPRKIERPSWPRLMVNAGQAFDTIARELEDFRIRVVKYSGFSSVQTFHLGNK